VAPSIGVNKDQFFVELDALGEAEVRARLASLAFSDFNEKGRYAREWLTRKDQQREAESARRNEEFQASQAATASRAADAAERAASEAKRASDAAERQAEAAERAVTMAKIANTIAVIALIVAAISLLRP
jgi:hypothetical protein